MVLSGKYKTGEQILRLTNERFAVPEILFHPSDIGIQEMGIPEAIVDSIQNLPEGSCIKQCNILSLTVEHVICSIACFVSKAFLSKTSHYECSILVTFGLADTKL